MKFKFFKSAAAFLSLGILMTGCSSDDFLADNDTPVEKDSKFYVNVSIANPAEQSTRANDNVTPSDYEAGTEAEQKIHKILFFFFNTSNKYVGSTEVTLGTDGKATIVGEDGSVDYTSVSQGDAVTGTPGSVETLLNVTIPVSVPEGSLKPASVIAVVNPTNQGTSEKVSYEQFVGITRNLEDLIPVENGHAGYTMSNSVYYDNSINDRAQVAVTIPSTSLFTSREEAASDENKNTKVTIYVERVVAKVSLLQTLNNSNKLKQTNNKVYSEDGSIEYTLDFDVLGWGLSMLEKGTFLIKNFRNASFGNCFGDDYNGYFNLSNMGWSAISSELSSLTSPAWNFPKGTESNNTNWGISGRRSFWAFSPSYFSTTRDNYPKYSDEFVSSISKADPNLRARYNLEYLTFNEIYNTTNSKLGDYGKAPGTITGNTTVSGEPIYTLEHTMVPSIVTDRQKTGVTCALVLGKYSVKGGESEITNQTFYLRSEIGNDNKPKNYIYTRDEDLMKFVLNANNKIFIKEGTAEAPVYTAINWDNFSDNATQYFEIKHPAKEVTDGKHTPNRFVSLHFKTKTSGANAEPVAENMYYRNTNGEYILITKDNLTSANKALYGLVGGIERYKNGFAYFAVPIEHLWGREDDAKRIGDDDFEAHLGQYGIVRNHIYNIKVQGIDGIGTGIGDPEVPIVPNVEEDKYYVNTEIRVQRWRIVPVQNVTLKP